MFKREEARRGRGESHARSSKAGSSGANRINARARERKLCEKLFLYRRLYVYAITRALTNLQLNIYDGRAANFSCYE